MCRPLMLAFLAVWAILPGAPAHGVEAIVATVNGTAITRTAFDRGWKAYLREQGLPESHAATAGKEQLAGMRQEVLDGLVEEELLHQEAVRKKLAASAGQVDEEFSALTKRFPSPEAFRETLARSGLTEAELRATISRSVSIRNLVEKEIAKGVSVTDAEVHEFYAGNGDTFTMPEQVRVRHILVKVDEKADAAAKEAARAKAEGLLRQVKGGADFAEVARKSSDCPSAAEGGDLGFFPRGQMVDEFDKAAFALSPGEVSGVVQTPFGFHVIRLEERKAAGLAPEAEVADDIREHLRNRKVDGEVSERLKALRVAAKVETFLD